MSESGGPTTQSGILYQNTWATLYLGRLIDPRPRRVAETVTAVRVEAPEDVDDIVISFADGSRTFIQAKESIGTTGPVWIDLWQDIADQFKTAKTDCDRFVLAIGTWTNDIGALREICQRAHGKSTTGEWWSSLAEKHQKVAQKIIDALPAKNKDETFSIVAMTEVWVQTLEQLQEESVPVFIPPSDKEEHTLFSLLRDMVGGKARIRGTFHQADLLDRLQREHKVIVKDTPAWGLDRYRQAIKKLYGTLAVPGTDVVGSINEMFLWLPLRDRSGETLHRDFEEEDLRWRYHRIEHCINLKSFPREGPRRAIIDASAGFGKTTLLQALAHQLSTDPVFIPAIVPLDALTDTKIPVHDYLNGSLNDGFEVALDWTRLCEGGRAIVFFDGLDELTDADRSWAVSAIARFNARFRQVAWLLTVRDGSALPQPLDAQRLDIERLDNELILALAKAYQAGGTRISIERLREHMEHHPDLSHLLRIPLFLAIVLATIKPEDDLPHSRSDLLETYLALLCSPERHKQVHGSYNVIDDLREAAEYLAFHGLEGDSVGLAEQQTKALLRKATFDERPGVYLERLLRFGLLHRQGTRLRFTYPIIQEYLAACWMVREMPKIVGERFRYVARRPWAQALQFSLEMHPNAENIIRTQLDQPDDAFHTVLRLIGRCIVNGTRLNPILRAEVGERLAVAWQNESWHISKSIGLLIADGFTSPLPNTAENILQAGRMLNHGGAEIVMAQNNPTFTAKVLEGFLRHDLEYQGWLHGWQEAVDFIANTALEMYTSRARAKETSAPELGSIAHLITQLPRDEISPEVWRAISADTTLPALIRMAGYNLGPQPIEAAAMNLLRPILQSAEPDAFWEQLQASNFFWNIEGAAQEFTALVAGSPAIQDRIIDDLTLKLFKTSHNNLAANQEILRSAIAGTNGDRYFRLKLMLAIAGDAEAAGEIVCQLTKLSDEIVQLWCWHANHFDESTSLKALDELKNRQPLDKKPISLISSLLLGITYEMKPSFDCGGVLDTPKKHPAYPQFIKWIKEILETKPLALDQQCRAAQLKKEFGQDLTYEEIHPLLLASWDTCQNTEEDDDDFWGNCSQVSSTIALMSIDMYSTCRPLLREIGCSKAPNANRDALFALARIGDEDELEWLARTYSEATKNSKLDIFEATEILASRLGKRIVRDGDTLKVNEW